MNKIQALENAKNIYIFYKIIQSGIMIKKLVTVQQVGTALEYSSNELMEDKYVILEA